MYDDMHAVITNECAEKGSFASPSSSSTLPPSQLLAPCVPCPQHQQHVIQAPILQPPLCTRDTWEHKAIAHTIRHSKAVFSQEIFKGRSKFSIHETIDPNFDLTHDKLHVY